MSAFNDFEKKILAELPDSGYMDFLDFLPNDWEAIREEQEYWFDARERLCEKGLIERTENKPKCSCPMVRTAKGKLAAELLGLVAKHQVSSNGELN